MLRNAAFTKSPRRLQSLDQCLLDLVKRGLVTRVSAKEYAKDKRLFE